MLRATKKTSATATRHDGEPPTSLAISKAPLTSPQEIAEGTWAVPLVFSYHYHEICKSWSISDERNGDVILVGMINTWSIYFHHFAPGFWSMAKQGTMYGRYTEMSWTEPFNATMRLRSQAFRALQRLGLDFSLPLMTLFRKSAFSACFLQSFPLCCAALRNFSIRGYSSYSSETDTQTPKVVAPGHGQHGQTSIATDVVLMGPSWTSSTPASTSMATASRMSFWSMDSWNDALGRFR